jgi:predicted RNase H-like nuclease (RuvC/YqgF family)
MIRFFKGLKKASDFFNTYPDDYCFIGRRRLKDLEHDISELKHEIKNLENKLNNVGKYQAFTRQGHTHKSLGWFDTVAECEKAIKDFKKQK